MDGSYDQSHSIGGGKLIMKLTWGCFIFFVVMLAGTMLIGNFFRARIKAEVDAQNRAAEAQLAAQRRNKSVTAPTPLTHSNPN